MRLKKVKKRGNSTDMFGLFFIFAHTNKLGNMKIGDSVEIAPDLTKLSDWVSGKDIEVKNNPFVGIVISVKTEDGVIFFGQLDLFKPIGA